jgi:hypothetical protein
MLHRFARVLVEAFFNDGDLDWLCTLWQLSLKNTYSMDSWDIVSVHVIKLLTSQTNEDFVLNLVRQSKGCLILLEVRYSSQSIICSLLMYE